MEAMQAGQGSDGGEGVSEGMCTLQAVTVWWFRHLVAWRHFVRRPRGGRSAFYYEVEYVNGFYDGPKRGIYFTRTRTPSHDHAHTHSDGHWQLVRAYRAF